MGSPSWLGDTSLFLSLVNSPPEPLAPNPPGSWAAKKRCQSPTPYPHFLFLCPGLTTPPPPGLESPDVSPPMP